MSTKRIDTLHDLIRHVPGALIAVRCRACGRGGHLVAVELARFYGGNLTISRLRFRCAECGSADVEHRPQRPPERASPARPRLIEDPG